MQVLLGIHSRSSIDSMLNLDINGNGEWSSAVLGVSLLGVILDVLDYVCLDVIIMSCFGMDLRNVGSK